MSTADKLASMPDDGNRYELIRGELRMMSPADGRHGRVAVRINKILAIHVDDNLLGATFAAETGFKITVDPDTVRAPDAAFVTQDKIDQLEDDTGYLPFAPDLAVEVVSPNDSFASVENKAFSWLHAGTELVLIVEPESKTIHSYRSKTSISVNGVGDEIDASDVVPGWVFKVADAFP